MTDEFATYEGRGVYRMVVNGYTFRLRVPFGEDVEAWIMLHASTCLAYQAK